MLCASVFDCTFSPEPCREGQFQCPEYSGSSLCYPLKYLCDSYQDCKSGYDEQNCSTSEYYYFNTSLFRIIYIQLSSPVHCRFMREQWIHFNSALLSLKCLKNIFKDIITFTYPSSQSVRNCLQHLTFSLL